MINRMTVGLFLGSIAAFSLTAFAAELATDAVKLKAAILPRNKPTVIRLIIILSRIRLSVI
jgi:hypothetical protein